jgi:hypothetical protein
MRQELVCAKMMKCKNSICHLPFLRAASKNDLQAVQGFDVARTLPAYLQGAHAPIYEMHPLETTVAVNL